MFFSMEKMEIFVFFSMEHWIVGSMVCRPYARVPSDQLTRSSCVILSLHSSEELRAIHAICLAWLKT